MPLALFFSHTHLTFREVLDIKGKKVANAFFSSQFYQGETAQIEIRSSNYSVRLKSALSTWVNRSTSQPVDVGNRFVGLKLCPSVKGTWHNTLLPPLLAVSATWRKSSWTIMWLMCEVNGFELMTAAYWAFSDLSQELPKAETNSTLGYVPLT